MMKIIPPFVSWFIASEILWCSPRRKTGIAELPSFPFTETENSLSVAYNSGVLVCRLSNKEDMARAVLTPQVHSHWSLQKEWGGGGDQNICTTWKNIVSSLCIWFSIHPKLVTRVTTKNTGNVLRSWQGKGMENILCGEFNSENTCTNHLIVNSRNGAKCNFFLNRSLNTTFSRENNIVNREAWISQTNQQMKVLAI